MKVLRWFSNMIIGWAIVLITISIVMIVCANLYISIIITLIGGSIVASSIGETIVNIIKHKLNT